MIQTGNDDPNRLEGSTGADTLTGMGGNDTYVVDHSGDVVVELAGEGSDTVEAAITWTLGDNVENLILTGTVIEGFGNGLGNMLAGNAAANRLWGYDGNDWLDGGTGKDKLAGGAGNDTYVVDHKKDQVYEVLGGVDAGGNDTVRASVTYTLAKGVENLILTGSAIEGFGSSTANSLTGNALANKLWGEGGNDLLDGGLGKDKMAGGAGNDTYIVDHTGDKIYEIIDGLDTGGDDLVRSSVTYTLGAFVESLTLTGTAETAFGNGLSNTLTGNASENRLWGYDGNDLLDGGLGKDRMAGGAGNDTYIVENAGDKVYEIIDGLDTGGTDTVRASITYTLGVYVENLILTGTAKTGSGNQLVNRITGNASDNILNGGLGADTLTGGLGNDSYYVDEAGDAVVEKTGEGYDIVYAGASYALGLTSDVEEAVLLAGEHINLTGSNSANTLRGNGGNNVLDGKGGADTLIGGAGDDGYYIDNAGDVVVEKAGEGTDTLYFGLRLESAYTLQDNIENLTALAGSYATRINGNALNNILIGTEATLQLDGGAGADTLIGGSRNNTYYVDNIGDVVIELAGEGRDEVVATASYSAAGNFVENIFLKGTDNIDATGNAGENYLEGNTGNNVLDGGAGKDFMRGGAGNDTYYVDSGDEVEEKSDGGIDTAFVSGTFRGYSIENMTIVSFGGSVYGGGEDNHILGSEGKDLLDGGSGTNSLAGGKGNDTYYVHGGIDTITELAGEGTDVVVLYDTYTLTEGAEVETMRLYDSDEFITTFDATGNGFANTIIGNHSNNHLNGGGGNDRIEGGKGDDALDGGTGADTLVGGSGNDSYYVDNIGDVIIENSGQGGDRIYSTISYNLSDTNYVENLYLTGSANINATGNDGVNRLYGTTGNNILDGGAGADQMAGGDGNDTYYIDDAGDTIIEVSGEGSDTVYVGFTYSLASYVEKVILTGSADIDATGRGSNNTLQGNTGANVLNGLAGNDILIGGGGADTFVFSAGSGLDRISDFSGDDMIDISAYTAGEEDSASVTITQVDADTVIDLGGGNIITVLDTGKAELMGHIVW